jgi:GNAT superfamily N-acetyltransferase
LRESDPLTSITPCAVGDHPIVLRLLEQVSGRTLGEDFQSRLDAPDYVAGNRLLLRRGRELIGHVRLSHRVGCFQGIRIPLAQLSELACLPEYRGTVYEQALLEVAEFLARREGAIAAISHTTALDPYLVRGWSRLRGQGHSRIHTASALAHLDALASRKQPARSQGAVGAWRHFQRDAISAIYAQQTEHQWGAVYRTEAAWQWLVARAAHDQILVALKGKTPLPPDAPPAEIAHRQIVGYAVLKGSCVIEMASLDGWEHLHTRLLAAACRDAIDRNHRFVALHAPATDPLHEVLVTAGGRWVPNQNQDQLAVFKLLSVDKWLDRLFPRLQQRAREAGIERPFHCDLVSRGEQSRYRLELTRRRARMVSQPLSIEQEQTPTGGWIANWKTLQSLLFGNLTTAQAISQQVLSIHSDDKQQELAQLFPREFFWQSPWESISL